MSDPTRPNDADLDRLDFDEVRRFLANRWKTIVATMVVCVFLAGVVCVAVTPVYTATSQILLDPRKQHVFGQDAVNPDSALDSSIVDSQIPIILSTRLLAKVIAKENLTQDPEFAAPAKAGLLDRIFGIFRGARGAKVDLPSFDGIDPKLAPVILHLFNKIDVTRVAKSYVLSISVSSRDPGKATRLANGLAETYVEDQVDVHAKSVQLAATFFEQRLGRLREQVRESERAVADFRKTHDLTTTTMDGKVTVGEQQLQALNEELAKISADTAEKLAKFDQAMHFKSSGTSLDTLPEIIRSPVITQLRAQQADLSRRESDLSATYGPAYPAITQIRAQRIGLDRAIAAEMKRLTSTLKNDYEVAKAREDGLRKTIAGLSDNSGGDNDVGVRLRELERANLANKALFENFLNRAKLTQEQSSFEEPDARLISPALEPSAPSSPKTKLILPVAAIAGLLIGLGLAAVLDLRTRRKTVRAPRQDDAFILARIPTVGAGGRNADLSAYMRQNPDSDFARSVEGLAAKLVPDDARTGRILALGSLGPREGATSLVLCIAEALGSRGRRVLLIDADHARRGLSRALAVDANSGFAEVVRGEVSASKAVVRRPHFALLPAGRHDLATASLEKPLRRFLDETRARFELVIVDAGTFVASPSDRTLAGLCDGFALVASWDQLMRDVFIDAIDRAAETPTFAGIVLNRTTDFEREELAATG